MFGTEVHGWLKLVWNICVIARVQVMAKHLENIKLQNTPKNAMKTIYVIDKFI